MLLVFDFGLSGFQAVSELCHQDLGLGFPGAPWKVRGGDGPLGFPAAAETQTLGAPKSCSS